MTLKHPYIGLPDRQFWENEPGIVRPALFDPVSPPPFSIARDEPIVTAGSCFAQHVARHLRARRFNHLVTEPAHPVFDHELAQRFNYGVFSARYGNIYTTRQLRQTLLRAYGVFDPIETSWPRGDTGRVIDPFRPQIQPDGFVSEAELLADRDVHLAAIRSAVEQAAVFVFTLGLTETWADRRDGAIFPLAPGVAGGAYDAEIFEFSNFGVDETTEDLVFALGFLRERNPDVKIILTVSPVPLNATMEDRHVFVSTTWSKAVLRIAAENACQALDRTVYFPSYEIITSPHARGIYYGDDRREVTDRGVRHVMRLFLQHFADAESQAAPAGREKADVQAHMAAMDRLVDALCDEEAISNR